VAVSPVCHNAASGFPKGMHIGHGQYPGSASVRSQRFDTHTQYWEPLLCCQLLRVPDVTDSGLDWHHYKP